ncbi:MAG: hypothetical protein O7D94_05055 [Planctomycetota bacterium]|nr:hypothetical protein [Planctomycetota bacterium]
MPFAVEQALPTQRLGLVLLLEDGLGSFLGVGFVILEHLRLAVLLGVDIRQGEGVGPVGPRRDGRVRGAGFLPEGDDR